MAGWPSTTVAGGGHGVEAAGPLGRVPQVFGRGGPTLETDRGDHGLQALRPFVGVAEVGVGGGLALHHGDRGGRRVGRVVGSHGGDGHRDGDGEGGGAGQHPAQRAAALCPALALHRLATVSGVVRSLGGGRGGVDGCGHWDSPGSVPVCPGTSSPSPTRLAGSCPRADLGTYRGRIHRFGAVSRL